MIRFEKVSAFADTDFNLPIRKTANSAGYDFEVAEDITVPTWTSQLMKLTKAVEDIPIKGYTLSQIAKIAKSTKAKPTLVPTGVKCYLEPGYYLELSVRSSTPLKYWLILANGVGVIDADYADNEDNEGHIFFQVINLSPYPIQLKRGDIIGQGIIKKYEITDDDSATGDRTGGFGSTTAPARGLRREANLFEEAIPTELNEDFCKGVKVNLDFNTIDNAIKDTSNKELEAVKEQLKYCIKNNIGIYKL